MRQSLSVVTPTYNERENIQILVPQILDVFRKNNILGEIIIVEDPSTDGSRETYEQLSRDIDCLRVIFRKPPNSISKAWYEGFMAASYENIVCIDADLCHDPDYFPEMLEKIKDFDIVIGSRYLNNRWSMMKEKSRLQVFVSIIGQHITHLFLGLNESDTSHSFRMFKKSIFLKIHEKLTKEGNVFLIQFLYYAKRANARVCEIPIDYGKRIHGTTKLSVGKEGLRYLIFVFSTFLKRIVGR